MSLSLAAVTGDGEPLLGVSRGTGEEYKGACKGHCCGFDMDTSDLL